MNAELLRNLWLEMSPRRLIWAGAVLGLTYATMFVLMLAGGGSNPWPLASQFGGFVFFVSVIWAGFAGAGSVLKEITGGTWDFQRLSALSPWNMTWGKLLGGASLPIATALTGIAAVAASEVGQGHAENAIWAVLMLAAMLVFLPATAMTLALLGVRKSRAEGRVAKWLAVIMGLAVGFPLFLLLMFVTKLGEISNLFALFSGPPEAVWWGRTMPRGGVLALVVLGLGVWAVIGAWRLMRRELQMNNSPLYWAAFLLSLAAALAGLAPAQLGLTAIFASAAATFMLMTYAMAFVEPADAVELRQFLQAARTFDLGAASIRTPGALIGGVLAFVAVVVVVIVGGGPLTEKLRVFVPALLTFMLRDLGVIAFMRLGPRPGQSDLSSVVAVFGLYLAAGILTIPSAFDHSVASWGWVLMADPDHGWLPAFSGLIQAAIVWLFVLWRLAPPKEMAARPA